MTRRLVYFAGIMSLIFGLSACSGQSFKNHVANQNSRIVLESTEDTEEGMTQPVTDILQTEQSDIESESQSLTEEQSSILNDATTVNKNQAYAYSKLDAEEQLVYQEILQALLSLTKEQQVSTTDADSLNKIFQCVMNDYPEIFYVNGYQYKLYTLQEKVTKIIFEGVYTKNASEIEAAKKIIGQYVDDCLRGMPQNADDYEKVKYLYEYIILHTEYSSESADSQNICSVFIDGQSVCQGYAKAMQYLCECAGVDATLVTGYANGEGHAWNLVNIEGQYYFVDVTWGDASYVVTGVETFEGNVPPITYDYLLVTTEMLENTHQIDNVVDMPLCNDMEYNYYVRENLYFSSFEEQKMENIFADAIEEGNQYVTIKCSDASVYTDMKEQLINEQKVFTYLANLSTSIAYSENPTQLTISFWLV